MWAWHKKDPRLDSGVDWVLAGPKLMMIQKRIDRKIMIPYVYYHGVCVIYVEARIINDLIAN